jgi:tetratricopeptide (TPR) repeat protein
LPAAWNRPRWLAPAVLGAICVALAGRTYLRNFDWQDEKSLFADAVRNSPNSYKAHMSLAIAWNDGTPPGLAKALDEIGVALRIVDPLPDPQNADVAYINAGGYYRQKGDEVAHKTTEEVEPAPAEAAVWYRKSLEMLLRAQKITAASNEAARRDDLRHGRRVAEYGWYQLDVELGRTWLRNGEPREALKVLDHGRRRRPEPIFFVEMAAAWVALGDLHRAALAMMEGLLIDPGYSRFASGMLEFYQKLDPEGCAIRRSGGQTGINLDCPAVHDDICTASKNVAGIYAGLNRQDKAAQILHTAANDLKCK